MKTKKINRPGLWSDDEKKFVERCYTNYIEASVRPDISVITTLVNSNFHNNRTGQAVRRIISDINKEKRNEREK